MTESSSIPHAVIVAGSDDLDERNPIRPSAVSPHLTYEGDGFRIRHLSFDAGAVLPEHVAPAPVIITVLAGRVLFRIGGIDHELAQAATIYADQDVPHVVTALEPSRLMLTLIG